MSVLEVHVQMMLYVSEMSIGNVHDGLSTIYIYILLVMQILMMPLKEMVMVILLTVAGVVVTKMQLLTMLRLPFCDHRPAVVLAACVRRMR